MSAKLSNEDLVTYFECIMDLEIDAYTKRNLISKMDRTYASLGKKYRIDEPQKPANEGFIRGFFTGGVAGAVIGGVIGAIQGFIEAVESVGFVVGIFVGIWTAFWVALLYAAIGGVILGVILGCIGALRESNKIEKIYETKMSEYNRKVASQDARLEREMKQKKAIAVEINDLKQSLSETQTKIAEIYNYNVVHPKYRDVFAISAFRDYFSTGMTYSLTFDSKTGDKGAYNIYENEKQMGMIIMSLREIIERLDEICDTQREIARCVQQANNNIMALHRDMNAHLGKVANSLDNIERCESLQAYNSQQIKYELQIMNWMNYKLAEG